MSDFLDRVSQLSPKRLALLALELQEKVEALQATTRSVSEPIAIVGLSCRFPGGARDAEGFWQLLHSGTDAIQEIDATRWNVEDYFDADPDRPGKIATRWGGFLSDVDQFDPQFFGISPREAMSMDPQQRLALEVSWEALERAGYAPDKLTGSPMGVFMGICNGDYAQLQMSNNRDGVDMYSATGNAHSVISGRIAYVLGLQGPAVSIDTACSSSLVAVHLAVQSLRTGECRMALAGGVNLILSPDTTIALSRAKMMATDGRCKAFDAAADGFVRSEGCGLVVLKRLSDALSDSDHILAVIRGSAINQDGRSNGLTAPNGPSQVAVIQQALANAGVRPDEIGYVETHGTGTSLGDPIEAQALGAALGPNRSTPLAIGSVKTNIGHAEAAAGIAGLIKVVLSLQHHEIPPHLHVKQLSPHIPWDELPLTIPTTPTLWQPINGRWLAGVSSFGFSGTNAHVIVEETPVVEPIKAVTPDRPLQVLTLSAKNDTALRELAARYAQHLSDSTPDFPSVCFTANSGRAHFQQRLSLIAADIDEARQLLGEFADGHQPAKVLSGQASANRRPEVVFMFTGQGAQYLDMGRQLYETQPTFRRIIDRCDELLRSNLDRSLIAVLYPQSNSAAQAANINDPLVAQPALFAIEYALAELWRSWGVTPSAVVGHSAGEYVAACVAGVFSLEDGLKLIATRARLMASLPPTGEMAAVFASEAQVADVIAPYANRVSIAAINWPESVVVSGEHSAVQAIGATLKDAGIRSRQLAIAIAAHSPLIEPILDEFERVAGTVTYAPPQIDFVSGVTGQIAQPHEVTNADYWRRHMRQTVRFASGIETLRGQGYKLFVEIGPAPTLIGMAQRCVPDGVWLPSLRPGQTDWQTLLNSLSMLYVHGVAVDWAGLDRDYAPRRRRVPLPTYPFQRQRCWFDQKTPQRNVIRPSALSQMGEHPLLGVRMTSPALSDIVFETQLSAQWPSFLDHHRIYGLAVLPSPVYIEMVLTAAEQAFGVVRPALEEFAINEALLLPEDGARTIQVIISQPQADHVAFQVFSRNANEWVRHATGKVNLRPAATAHAALSLDEIKRRCATEISGEDYYARVRHLGLEFGAKFRGITQVWRRDGEALGLIELPIDLSAEAVDYHIHPALLDACFHVLGAPLPQTADPATYLLIGLDRFVLQRAPGTRLWNHTVLRETHDAIGEIFTGDIHLFDDDGQLVAEAQGLHLKRATREALRRVVHKSQVENWLYQVQWQLALPLPEIGSASKPSAQCAAMMTPAEIAARVQPDLAQLSRHYELHAYDEMLPAIDALASAYAIAALGQLGWQPGESITAEELAVRLGITTAQRRLFKQLLANLDQAQGVLDPQTYQAQLAVRYPAAAAELALLQRCGSQLAGVLRGEVDPLQLLFPAGSLGLTEALYRTAPFAQAYNTLAQHVLAEAVCDCTGPLRVLEIGAGSGATTAALLEVLPSDRTEYTFTDISPLFLQSAAGKFQAYPFIRYQLLDIECDPVEQDFGARTFDVIIAANVLHATRDLRQTLRHVKQLLAPRGLLLLIEGTEPQHWVDVTFGLTSGWWRFHDLDLRPDYPLLSAEKWIDLLATLGFEEVATLALPQSGAEVLGQAVIIATAPTGERWLMCGEDKALTTALAAHGASVDVVVANDQLAPLLSAHDYRGVIVSAPEAASATAWCETALRAMQAMLQSHSAAKLWIITRGAQAVKQPVIADASNRLNPAQAALWGLGRGISVEHPAAWGGLIDLAPNDLFSDEAVCDRVVTELFRTDGEDQVAWRKDDRYTPRLVRTSLGQCGDWQPSPDGAYLITGGLGGLGLKVAEWLVQRGARHLVLLGRSGLEGQAAARKVRAIEALKALGTKVTVIANDVADRSQMVVLFDRFGRDLPALRGVVHAAAAWSSAPFETLSAEALRDMLRPKVDGAWLLHELTADKALDFFVLFSSTTALWGARQLAHYAAANAYLDALAHYRRSLGLPALSINWGTWAEMRTASRIDQQSYAQFGLRPMPNDQALDILGKLLARPDVMHITVADIEWRTLKAAYEAKRPRPFLAQVETLSQPHVEHQVSTARSTAERSVLQQRLVQASVPERREVVASFVRAEVAKVLRLGSSHANDDQQGLFEMGMDSLMSVELKSRLEAGAGHALPSTLTFNYPTIAALTDYLLADLSAALPTPVSQVILPASEHVADVSKPDELSEDELAERLAAKLAKLG